MQLPYEVTDEIVQDAPSLASLLSETARFLWKDWPRDMEIVTNALGGFNLTGECPHAGCRRSSVFVQIGGLCQESAGNESSTGRPIMRGVVVTQCQGCKKFVLAVATMTQGSSRYVYEEHYPLGTPDDSVAEEIPVNIATDFKEALRCLFVNAYNATAEMCRRAVEASCIEQGAPKTAGTLEEKIDWLASKGIITPFMAEVAHKIRLGGNRGAHPPDEPPAQESFEAELVIALTPAELDQPLVDDNAITKAHAEAIVKFTREYFQDVYVVPKELKKYDFSKRKSEK